MTGAPRWSSDTGQADWIGPRLTPWDDPGFPMTVVVPAGFGAYARVLHPACRPGGEGTVRWAEVAAWSGLPLRPDGRFHSVALPAADPGVPPPYGAGPGEGSLDRDDLAVLAGLVRDWTTTPEDCWFAVWEGYGWDHLVPLVAAGQSGRPVPPSPPDPVPGPVRAGPRVELPNRSYLLYQGPAEAAMALAELDGTGGQSPNLWWPADRAWCVATEIDLPWTYVGGPRGLIDAILADGRVEALPAEPDEPVNRVEDWVEGWSGQLYEDVMREGTAFLRIPLGTVEATLRRPRRIRHGSLTIEVTGREGGSSTSWNSLGGPGDHVGSSVRQYLTRAVLSLCGE